MKERDLYSIDEARERLGGISRNLIYEILRSGRLSSVVLGSRRFIPAAAITQLIAQSATTISPAEAAARSYIPTKQPIDISQRRPSQGDSERHGRMRCALLRLLKLVSGHGVSTSTIHDMSGRARLLRANGSPHALGRSTTMGANWIEGGIAKRPPFAARMEFPR